MIRSGPHRDAALPTDVHVVRIDLDAAVPLSDPLFDVLSDDERQAAARFHQAADAVRSAATRAVLRLELAAALGEAPTSAFLTIGRLQLAAFARAPQHRYLVRSIDPVGPGHGLARATFVAARGPFTVADEAVLMRAHAIAVLVTKNSGGPASAAKIEAARRLGLRIVLVGRPAANDALDVEAAVAAIRDHDAALRGV